MLQILVIVAIVLAVAIVAVLIIAATKPDKFSVRRAAVINAPAEKVFALIADFHPGETRSRAVGIHQMGIYAGIVLGGFAGYAADAPDIGWRRAFDVLTRQ